jgi:hypothetical protein
MLTKHPMRMLILSERSESKDLSPHPTKGVCPERPLVPSEAEGSGVKDLSSNPMRMLILSERSESKDLSSHPTRESVLRGISRFVRPGWAYGATID